MTEILVTTLQKVAMMFTFISVGYLLRRTKKLPDNTGKVLSLLTTTLFCPAYNIQKLSSSVTLEKIGQKFPLVGYGALVVFAAIGLAYLLAKLIARDEFEKRSLIYALSIPNYGYFGYPVIEGVFGLQLLADVMLFAIPLSIATNTFGYLLFARDAKLSWKSILTKPLILAIPIGCALGLAGIELPAFLSDALDSAGKCMSPASMLLAGFVLGGFPLKKMVTGAKTYLISFLRLVGIHVIMGAVLFLLGVRGDYLAIPLLLFSLPLGLNLVVYPESLGRDASDNAKLCFTSYLMAVVVLPFTYAAISWLITI